MIFSGNKKWRAIVLNKTIARLLPFSFPKLAPTHASNHLLPLSHCGSNTIRALILLMKIICLYPIKLLTPGWERRSCFLYNIDRPLCYNVNWLSLWHWNQCLPSFPLKLWKEATLGLKWPQSLFQWPEFPVDCPAGTWCRNSWVSERIRRGFYFSVFWIAEVSGM